MKLLLRGLVVVVVAVLILGVIAYFSIDTLARRGIVQGTTHATGTETRLESANLALRRGELRLHELEIANPENFDAPHFLQLRDGHVAVTLGSLLREEVEIPRLHLDGIDLRIEQIGTESNYQTILDHLEEVRGEPAEVDDDGKRYIIRELTVSDVNVTATVVPPVGDPATVTLNLDDIRLTDVGSETEGGVLLSQVSATVVQAVLEQVIDQAGDVLPDLLASGLRDGLGDLGRIVDFDLEQLEEGIADIVGIEGEGADEMFEGVLEDVREGIGEGEERIREGAEQLEEQIEGLEGIFQQNGDN